MKTLSIRKITSQLLIVAACGVLLSACQPPEQMMFGVPKSQWNALSPSQKQQVIQGYNQTQRINAQNAPINNTIGAASRIIQNENYMKRNPGFTPMPPMPGGY